MARFEIGTEFLTREKHPRIMTVVDIHVTHNSAGELVKTRYVAEHSFMGQLVTSRDILSTTIARGVERLKEQGGER